MLPSVYDMQSIRYGISHQRMLLQLTQSTYARNGWPQHPGRMDGWMTHMQSAKYLLRTTLCDALTRLQTTGGYIRKPLSYQWYHIETDTRILYGQSFGVSYWNRIILILLYYSRKVMIGL